VQLWGSAAEEALRSMNNFLGGGRFLTEYKARVSDFAICGDVWNSISDDIANAT